MPPGIARGRPLRGTGTPPPLQRRGHNQGLPLRSRGHKQWSTPKGTLQEEGGRYRRGVCPAVDAITGGGLPRRDEATPRQKRSTPKGALHLSFCVPYCLDFAEKQPQRSGGCFSCIQFLITKVHSFAMSFLRLPPRPGRLKKQAQTPALSAPAPEPFFAQTR